jgi:hypothetical protein
LDFHHLLLVLGSTERARRCANGMRTDGWARLKDINFRCVLREARNHGYLTQ